MYRLVVKRHPRVGAPTIGGAGVIVALGLVAAMAGFAPSAQAGTEGARLDPLDYPADPTYQEWNDLPYPAAADVTFDTDTGEVTMGVDVVTFGQLTATENGQPVWVWSFADLVIPGTAVVSFTGSNAGALISQGDLVVNGTISGLTGGWPGGPTAGSDGSGPGAGQGGTGEAGGGGAGYGGVGGAGGVGGGSGGGAAGVTYGVTDLSDDLFGGSGGGAGGTDTATVPEGGGGGGAIELVALGAITINNAVDANGAAGVSSVVLAIFGQDGGGGGAGGALLLNAPFTALNGTVSAVGGNGAHGKTVWCGIDPGYGGGGGGGGRVAVFRQSGAGGIADIDVSGGTAGDGCATATAGAAGTGTIFSAPSVSITYTGSDPYNSPVFDVVFGETVADFADGDVVFGGTATGVTYAVNGAGQNYTITVTGATTDGTVTPIIPQAVATGPSGYGNFAAVGPTVELDTTPPDPPSLPDLRATSDSGIDDTDNITFWTSLVFEGTAPADTTVTLYSDVDGPLNSGTAVGGNWAITVVLTENTHQITAVAEDAAGNPSAASPPLTVVVDISVNAPSVPDLVAASDHGPDDTDNITNDDTPTFTGTAEPNAMITIDTDLQGVVGTEPADGTGTYLITVSALSQGGHFVRARAEDVAGNVSFPSFSLPVDIDTDAPDVSGTVPQNGATIGNLSEIRVTFDEEVAGVAAGDLDYEGSPATNVTPPIVSTLPYVFTGFANPTDSPPGRVITLAAGATTDMAGNPFAGTSWSVTKNTAIPTVDLSSGDVANGGFVRVGPVAFTALFSETVSQNPPVFDQSDVVVGGVGGSVSAFEGSADPTFTFDVTPAAEGLVTVQVPASVAEGDALPTGRENSASVLYEFTYDETPPTVTVDGPVQTTNPSPELTGTIDDPDAVVTVQVDVQSLSAVNNMDGTWTLSAGQLAALADGTYDVQATGEDPAGNIGSGGLPGGLSVDATPPAVDQIVLLNADPTLAQVVGYEVTFDEDMTAVSTDDFAVTTGSLTKALVGAAVVDVAQVTPQVYDVSVDRGAGFGTIRLDIVTTGVGTDLFGNPIAAPYTSGPTYAISDLSIDQDLPSTVEATEDDRVVLLILASSSVSFLSYQWYQETPDKATVLLPDETTNMLVFDPAETTHSGQYFVEVSDALVSLTSNTATLTVQPRGLPVMGWAGLGVLTLVTAFGGAVVLRCRKR